MATISKIPQEVNRYSIKRAIQIRHKNVEHLKLIKFERNEVWLETPFIKGTKNKVQLPVSQPCYDILIHNHPDGFALPSYADIVVALQLEMKKIFVSADGGFSSIDFTTAKKNMSNAQICNQAKVLEDVYTDAYFTEGPKFLLKNIINFLILEPMLDSKSFDKACAAFCRRKIVDFARKTGVTFSEVKWNDYARLD